jgi:hypothetical protein
MVLSGLLFVSVGCCGPAAVREATYKAVQNNTASLQKIRQEAVPYLAVLRDLLEQAKERGLKGIRISEDTVDEVYVIDKETLESILQLTGRQEVGAKVYETLFEMWDSRLGSYVIRSKAIEAGVKVDREFTTRSP